MPRGRWRNVTLVSTVTPTGMGPSLLIAGATDRPVFDACVERWLAPALRPGQTVVLDNLSVHKNAKARARIEAAGRQLRLLPTYSPDFNPIEQAFAKFKTHQRRTEARTIDDLVDATPTGLNAITAADARAFYRDAGCLLMEQQL